MTIDVSLGFVSNEAAYRRARTVAPWLAVAAVFVATVLLRQVVPVNVDVSWGLIESERMLDGQRVHLVVLAMLPAIGVYILRANRDCVTPAAVLIAALGAAITLCFKPYFVFAVGFCIFAAAAQARDWRVVFAPENWIAAALVVVYAICIFVFYPEYFTIIYPLARDVYLLLKAPILALFLTSATALWLGAVMIVLALQSRQQKLDTACFVLLAASFGFAISFFVQRKGWDYLAYPMVALGLLAAGCAISAIDNERTSSRRLRVAAMFVVLAMFTKACMGFNASVDVRQIQDRVARLGPHPRILMLGAAAGIGHPMVRTLQRTSVSRQNAPLVPGTGRPSLLDQTNDPQTAARLEGYVARERAGLIEDFRKQPPDVILVDNQDSDWGSWARADPELSALLKSYTPVRTINGIDILQRTNEARS